MSLFRKSREYTVDLSKHSAKQCQTITHCNNLEKGNLTDQMKVSLKKFQATALVLSDEGEMKLDSAMVIEMKDALVAQE